MPLAIHAAGQSRHGQVGARDAGRRNQLTTCHRCSARGASGRISRAKAIGVLTSGTTRTTGIRARRNLSPSCRLSPGSTRDDGQHDAEGRSAFSPSTTPITTGASPRASSTRTATGSLRLTSCRRTGRSLDVWPVQPDGTGGRRRPRHARLRPSAHAARWRAVEAYLQTLGTAIGDWRIWEPSPTNDRPAPTEPLALRARPRQDRLPEEVRRLPRHVRQRTADRRTRTLPTTSTTRTTSSIPQPRNFTLGVFKSRTTPVRAPCRGTRTSSAPSRGAFARARSCRPGATPPTATCSPEPDRWDLVDYVKTFSDRFQKEERPAADRHPRILPSRARPDAPAELVREGKLVYRVLQCWTCHGMGGQGRRPVGQRAGRRLRSPDPPLRLHHAATSSSATRRPTCIGRSTRA